MSTETPKPSVFAVLNKVNVNKLVEKKKDLTYLPWADAWSEVMKVYPDATYEVWMDETHRPYIYDPITGYMVHTSVTIEGVTRKMWLPVMDSNNNAMLDHAYTYKAVRYVNNQRKEVDVTVDAASMFDINKAIMRCLVKNIAMFGLGLYIYRDEDEPDGPEAVLTPPAPQNETEKPQTRALIDLKVGSENWKKAAKFIKDNRTIGFEKIVAQLKRKYTISAEVAKEIEKLIEA